MTHYYKPPGYEESFTDPEIIMDSSPSTSVDYACGDQSSPNVFYDVNEGVSRRRISRNNLDRLHRELTRYKGSLLKTYNYLKTSIERTPHTSKTSIFADSCHTCIEGEEIKDDIMVNANSGTCVDTELYGEVQLPVSVSSMTLQYVQYHFQNLIKYAIDSYWSGKEIKNKVSTSSLPGNLVREPHAIRSCPSNDTTYADAVNKDASNVSLSSVTDQFVSIPAFPIVKTPEKPSVEKVSEMTIETPPVNLMTVEVPLTEAPLTKQEVRMESSIACYCDEVEAVSSVNKQMLVATVVFNVALYLFILSSSSKKADVVKEVYLTSLDQLMIMVDH